MWIKHYSNARQSEFLSKLYAEFGWEGYGRYWGLLEFLAKDYAGGDPVFHISKHELRGLLAIQSWTKLELFLNWISTESQPNSNQTQTKLVLKFNPQGSIYQVEAPILLDLLNRDFKRARKERAKDAPREEKIRKDKDKIKNNSSSGTQTKFEHPNNLQEFIAIFDEVIFAHWLRIYQNDADWINRELEKCYGYFYVQKTKAPSSSKKGWTSRASSWLERGWENFSKNKPSLQNSNTPQLKNAHLLKMLGETK
jgi:hypothetical protein